MPIKPASVRPSFVRPSSSTISNIFFSKTTGPVIAKFYVELLWVGVTLVCLRHLGHMTKMAAKPIYGKNSSKIFSGTSELISTKLGLKHLGLQPIIVLANDDPGLTLTHFTARSNFETSFSKNLKTLQFVTWKLVDACK